MLLESEIRINIFINKKKEKKKGAPTRWILQMMENSDTEKILLSGLRKKNYPKLVLEISSPSFLA